MTTTIEQFGRGILCPFQRDGKNDFANGVGAKLLKSDIGELLGIIGPTANSPGEVPWNTELGSAIHTLRHRKLHAEMTRASAEMMTAGVVRRFERRVRVGPTTASADTGRGAIEVRTSFTPIGTRPAEPLAVSYTIEE